MSVQKPRPGSIAAALFGLVGFSALAGLLITVMVTPALAVTSIAAKQTIGVFDNLPEYLEVGATPQQNIIEAISGTNPDGTYTYKQIATVYSQNRKEIEWKDVTPVLKDAVLAAEDRRFYQHGGIDPQGIARAVVTNLGSGGSQGASTLTQQLVKNICINTAVTTYSTPADETKKNNAIDACQAVTIERKIKEMKQAIGLEKQLTKNQIMLAYLNIAGFGGNIYGIESAAERYYSTTADKLTIAQAASLVGIVQQPTARRLDIAKNYPTNKARRDVIIGNMAEYGYISAADEKAALALPVDASTVIMTAPSNGCIAANSYAKQFCDYVVNSVKDYTQLGDTPAAREAAWKVGGYTLKTTLDLRMNKVAQDSLRKYAPIKEKALQLGASAVSIQPGTGRIVTMAQNKVFDPRDKKDGGGGPGTSAINFNTDYLYGGSSGFQPGSSYKVFTLLNWLSHGHGLDEIVNVTPVKTPQQDFNADGCGGPYGGTPYSPKNDSGERGYYSVRDATAHSINGGYVQMALQLSLCDTRDIALSLGFHRAAAVPEVKNAKGVVTTPAKSITDLSTVPSSILGVDETAPMTIAAAYAAVANHGIYCTPISVDDFIDSSGKDLGGQQPDCAQSSLVDKDTAAAAASALGSAAAGYVANPKDGTPLIGKTGTTNSSNQTWVTLSSTALTTTVWYGNIAGTYPIRNYGGGGTFGGNQRHLIMHDIMVKADKLYKGGAFDVAPDRLLHGVNVNVGNFVGMDESTAQAAITAQQLVYSNEGDIASPLPLGQVAKQVPAAGQPVAQGQKVQYWLSDGTKSIVPDVTTAPQDFPTAQAAIMAAGFPTVNQTCVPTAVRDGSVDPATGLPINPQLPTDGQVVSVSPAAGTTLVKTKPVSVGVAHAIC